MEDELDRVIPGPRAVTLDDLPALAYTSQVIEEGMRLRPPVWLIARSVTEDDVLAGTRVPGGTVVFFSPWVVHRNPRLWDDPLAFRPERFTAEACEGRHRYAYFPFSGGPRMCIGDAFARMEAKIILGTLARRFRVVPAGPAPIPDPSVTLRMLHGFRCRLERR
jgi:cytochrome P450